MAGIFRTDPVLILRITGGLGNQMFQYAFGRAYEAATGIPVVHEKLTLGEDYHKRFGGTRRDYELGIFGIARPAMADTYANRAMFVARDNLLRRIVGNLCIKILGIDFTANEKWQSRSPYIFYADAFDKVQRPTFINSFFQSPKYFDRIEGVIRSVFNFPDEDGMSEGTRSLAQSIRTAKVPISLHVRRGDYVKYNDTFHLCGPDYYSKAIEMIESTINPKDITYFVFSDDIDYARSVFNGDNFVFSEDNPEKGNHEDMYLMSICHHNIIANSSYSWWGAWLNANADKIVIGPRDWMVNGVSSSSSDLFPKNWIILG